MENKKIIIYNAQQIMGESINIDIPTAFSSMIISIAKDDNILCDDYSKTKEIINYYLELFEKMVINNNDREIYINYVTCEDLYYSISNGIKQKCDLIFSSVY